MNKIVHFLKISLGFEWLPLHPEIFRNLVMKCSEILAALGCLIVVVSCNNGSGESDRHGSAFPVLKVENTDVVLTERYPATIQGRQDIAIYPQVSGTISKVNVTEGQRVRKGQSLFVIDQVPFKAALQMAQANVESANAGVATAQLLYDSRVELFNRKVISEFDMLTAKNQLLTAKAALAQAEAQLVTANNNMTYTMVLSPADGVVGTLPFREGALVSPSVPTPLTTVSDNSVMYVYYSLSETKLLELMDGKNSMGEVLASMPDVELELADGSTYPQKGKVESISGVIDPNTASVSVRAVFPNAGGILHSGASGRVVLAAKHNDAIVIPCTATFDLQDLVCAWKVVGGKSVLAKLSVKLSDDGKSYVVASGLEEGDVIISEGAGLVSEGQEITVVDQNATSQSNQGGESQVGGSDQNETEE